VTKFVEVVTYRTIADKTIEMIKPNCFTLLLFFCSLTAWQVSSAATKYITDEFEVTMRSGTSTSNNIIRMLKSGQTVKILEQDLISQYSLVETEEGKTGYVLSRFLLEGSSARNQLEKLKVKDTEQIDQIIILKSELKDLKQALSNERTDNSQLQETLQISEDELDYVKEVTKNTRSILDDNNRLKSIEMILRTEKRQLSEENANLNDSTEIDWFVRGAAVSLIAFLLGIAITRISWKKKDSWGSY
jgi:SH3 domain protein